MRVLIIEDDPKKSDQLHSLVRESLPNAVVEERRSYQSGLKCLITSPPDLVLLDMSMPTFDRSVSEKGGRTRPYGGRDILREMQRKGISAPVVVVTGFETFGEPAQRMTLEELANDLEDSFAELYQGVVYYHPARSDWRDKLSWMIRTHIHSDD